MALIDLTEARIRALTPPTSQQLYNWFYTRDYAAKLILMYLSGDDVPKTPATTYQTRLTDIRKKRQTYTPEKIAPSPTQQNIAAGVVQKDSQQGAYVNISLYDHITKEGFHPEGVGIEDLGLTNYQYRSAWEMAYEIMLAKNTLVNYGY